MIYIDSANIEEVIEICETGIISGITTNPTLIKNTMKQRDVVIREINEERLSLVFIQLVGSTMEQMLEDYELILDKFDDKVNRLVIKIPINLVGLKTIKKIKENFPTQKILGTAIYSASQAIMGIVSGCDYVAPYINRMEKLSIDPYVEIRTMREYIDDRGFATEILGASYKTVDQVIKSLNAGVHSFTASYEIITSMIDDKNAAPAIIVFNLDGGQSNV